MWNKFHVTTLFSKSSGSLKKSKAEDEYEEMKKYLKSKNDRLTEIDQLLRVPKAV